MKRWVRKMYITHSANRLMKFCWYLKLMDAHTLMEVYFCLRFSLFYLALVAMHLMHGTLHAY